MQWRNLAFSGIILGTAALGIAIVVEWQSRQQARTLTLATASASGEYYAFGRAFARVVARHHPKIKIEVIATAGSRDNARRLEQGEVQLAIAQSDTPLPVTSELVAQLFPEIFHLLARAEADIQQVSDLRGRRIALMPEGSGSYDLFWPLVERFGLARHDFTAITLPPAEAHRALAAGEVDGMFRVLALGNPGIGELLSAPEIQLLPVDRAAALQLTMPFLEPTVIPEGAYSGALPQPPRDIPVVALRSLLIAHTAVDADLIYSLTETLHDRRSELIAEYANAAQILRPDLQQQTNIPVHPGAELFYTQEQPNFFVRYAEFLGLLITVSILTTSGLWQLKAWWSGRQKNRADSYNLQILDLIDKLQHCSDLESLEKLRIQLFGILREVVVDLDEDRITAESFRSFALPWEVAISVMHHRELLLASSTVISAKSPNN